jgi:hypothetical protein
MKVAQGRRCISKEFRDLIFRACSGEPHLGRAELSSERKIFLL